MLKIISSMVLWLKGGRSEVWFQTHMDICSTWKFFVYENTNTWAYIHNKWRGDVQVHVYQTSFLYSFNSSKRQSDWDRAQDWMVTFQSYFLHLFLLECWLFCYSSIWQGLEYFVSTFIFIGWRWNFNKLWEVCLCEVEFYFNFVLKVYLCLPLIYGTFWI